MEPVIKAVGLSRRFRNVVAVDQLDLTVERGQVFGFLGPNGAGKTTTVRMLNGVLNPSAGSATVLGYDVAVAPNEIRRRTGVLTETPNLYENLTARENLRFFGEVYGVPEERLPGRIDAVLDEMGLLERASEPVGGYSKGMKQRLAVARALLHEPSLLFLDEPTAGLDPEAALMVTDMIQALSRREGRTVFLCTHNLLEAQRLCDRVGVISQGVLRAVGSPDELARHLWSTLKVRIECRANAGLDVSRVASSQPGVRSVEGDGDALIVELDGRESVPTLVGALVTAGAAIYGVVVQKHSLEDVYFEIQGGNHSDGDGGQA
jgi:ABC-2 type transport system ATP-binding protein